MRLKDKVAVITGASTGIGRAIAESYAREGASIVVADIRGAAEAAVEIGQNALGITTDVSDPQSTHAMAVAAINRFGRVDILVNNAGIFTGLNYTPMEALAIADWQKILAVNVMGPWLCASAVSPNMRANGGGKIINIASVIAHLGIPFMLHYVASKGALAAMTRSMAREFAATKAGITVNAISPGYIHSPNAMANAAQHEQFEAVASQMRTIERAQTPQDIAGAALWLASGESSTVNGQNIIVDGGIFMSL